MQREFDFHSSSNGDGLASWHAQRQAAEQELSKALGLPLGHQCEVWLKDGLRLRGLLRLEEAGLFAEGESHQHTWFEIDGVRFLYGQMESCLRID